MSQYDADVANLFQSLKRYSFSWLNLIGQDKWDATSWTPTRTGWTDVGTPTVVGRFRKIGKMCEFQVQVTPGTSIATTAGTSYIALPLPASGLAGVGTMDNQTTKVAVGVCSFDVTNSRIYVPTQGASGNTFGIAGSYEVM